MMNVQTFYPIFADGQVLTSDKLNDILDYLEPQDRSGRRLTGIGIVSGFEPDWNPATATLTLSAGMAVTSDGFLISDEAVILDRARAYSVPVPSGDEATAEIRERARYPYLFSGNVQREALELLPIDFRLAEGEAPPVALTEAMVADKTVLLFLERNLEALKNCNINDCSDRGSELILTLRRLLVSRDVADRIIAEEAALAGRPTDRATHPRRGLAPLDIEKIHPARFSLDTVGKLHQRTLDTVVPAFAGIFRSLRDSWNAYRYLLQADYPASAFPDGPVPNHFFLNAWAAYAEMPAMAQYLHGLASDLVRSHNEFLAAAACFEFEAFPDARRFPLHVLAGDVASRRRAFNAIPANPAAYKEYDPSAIQGGVSPQGPPLPRRHHFVPSDAVANGADRTEEVRSLFARTVLLAQSFATRGLAGGEIRLTPSRGGAARLGERAIPFYYGFQPGGDLIRNWSYPKARTETYGSIFSYQFSQTPTHPFLFRRDGEDFIRIEGVIGRALGSAMLELQRQRRELGLSFAIEPVWIAWDDDDLVSDARDSAKWATRSLLLCRLNQIEIVFATVMDSLFEFAVWLVQALGKIDPVKAAKQPVPGPAVPPMPPILHAVDFVRFQPADRIGVKIFSSSLRREMKVNTLSAAQLVQFVVGQEAAVVRPTAQPKSVAEIYAHVSDDSSGGELIDRLREAVGRIQLGVPRDDAIQIFYPSVALIARAQELMRATRGASLSDFDEDRFATVMRGFAGAYDAYSAVAELDDSAGKEVVNTNTAIIANRGFVATMASQFASGSMSGRVDQQLGELFEEMVMPRYAQLHPGLEHSGGVPQGGTYVLLYASRGDVEKRMKKLLENANLKLDARTESIGVRGLKIDRQSFDAIEKSSRPSGDDVLEEFVVIADFCLPYLCCEGRCGEQELEQRYGGRPVTEAVPPIPPAPPPEPPPPVAEPAPPPPAPETPPPPAPAPKANGRLTVSVNMSQVKVTREERADPGRIALERLGRTAGGGRLAGRGGFGTSLDAARARGADRVAFSEVVTGPLPGSDLSIVNMDNGQASSQFMREAERTIELPAGRYLVSASLNGVSSGQQQIDLGSGEQRGVTLTISMNG